MTGRRAVVAAMLVVVAGQPRSEISTEIQATTPPNHECHGPEQGAGKLASSVALRIGTTARPIVVSRPGTPHLPAYKWETREEQGAAGRTILDIPVFGILLVRNTVVCFLHSLGSTVRLCWSLEPLPLSSQVATHLALPSPGRRQGGWRSRNTFKCRFTSKPAAASQLYCSESPQRLLLFSLPFDLYFPPPSCPHHPIRRSCRTADMVSGLSNIFRDPRHVTRLRSMTPHPVPVLFPVPVPVPSGWWVMYPLYQAKALDYMLE
ncbi:hypothetical protein VTI74DRAFT_6498 [Chaetomium olivicolor]